MKKFICALAFALPCLTNGLWAGGGEIEGYYETIGYDPFSEEYYTAHLEIEERDHVYFATWTYNDESTDEGTGIRVDDILSFGFQSTIDPTFAGVQVYHIKCGQLYGPWAFNGYDLVGEEVAKKIFD